MLERNNHHMTRKNSHSKARNTRKQATKAQSIVEEVEAAEDASPEREVQPRKAAKVTRSQIAAERIEDEYAYIVGDLRQVFLLAAAMFILLIALNVILGFLG